MIRSSSEKNLKPFRKGYDYRRAKGGAACIERTAWTNLFLNRLAKRLKPADAADILATAYEKGRPWAIAEVHERLMGKVTQPIGGTPDGAPIRVRLEKVITTIDPNGSSGD
jgi:hypothetical protein